MEKNIPTYIQNLHTYNLFTARGILALECSGKKGRDRQADEKCRLNDSGLM